MEVDREKIGQAVDEVIKEYESRANEKNNSAFLVTIIRVVGNELKERLIEKLFGGQK